MKTTSPLKYFLLAVLTTFASQSLAYFSGGEIYNLYLRESRINIGDHEYLISPTVQVFSADGEPALLTDLRVGNRVKVQAERTPRGYRTIMIQIIED